MIEKHQQLRKLIGKIIGRPLPPLPSQRMRLQRTAARRAPNAQVHTSRIERMQRAKDLRHLVRAVMRQHDAAGADPDPRRLRPDARQQHLRRGTRQQIHGVMLRHPVAVVAQPLHMLCQLDGIRQRLRGRRPLRHRRLVQHRKPHPLAASHNDRFTHVHSMTDTGNWTRDGYTVGSRPCPPSRPFPSRCVATATS